MEFNINKPTNKVHYRWNCYSHKWQWWDVSVPQTLESYWEDVPEPLIDSIPPEIIKRAEPLITKVKESKAKAEQKRAAGFIKIKEDVYKTKIPLNYVYGMVTHYLKFNNYPSNELRMKLVERLFDVEHKISFKDIKTINNQAITKYDDCLIADFFTDYVDQYLRLVVKNSKQLRKTDFSKILYEISWYLIGSKERNSEEKRKKRDEYRLVYPDKIQPEDSIGDENPCDLDSAFNSNSQMKNDLMKIYYIPQKEGKKKNISWEAINRIKIQYDKMTDEQKMLYEQMKAIEILLVEKQSVIGFRVKKQLYSIKKELQQKINLLFLSEGQSKSVGYSSNAHIFECNEDFFANQILEELDYTNPLHISSLIELFHELDLKHAYNVDNPIYAIIQDFKLHINEFSLSSTHMRILEMFIYRSSDKKKIAELLDMTTEKLMRTMTKTISKKISKYFVKMSGT